MHDLRVTSKKYLSWLFVKRTYQLTKSEKRLLQMKPVELLLSELNAAWQHAVYAGP